MNNAFHANNTVSVLSISDFFPYSENCIVFDVADSWFVTQRATNVAWQPGFFRPESIHHIASKIRFFFLSTKWMSPKKIDFSQEMLGNTDEWLTFGFSLQYYYNVQWTGDEKKRSSSAFEGLLSYRTTTVSNINTERTKVLLGCVSEKVKHLDIYQLEINRPGEWVKLTFRAVAPRQSKIINIEVNEFFSGLSSISANVRGWF